MNKSKIALIITLLLSNQSIANEDSNIPTLNISNEELKNRILSLTITPFADLTNFSDYPIEIRQSFPSNLIVYKNQVSKSCDRKVKNSLNFVDFEGSSYGNFHEQITKLPNATNRIDQLINGDYKKIKITEDKIIKSFDLIKNKYCIDVIFSPVIDFRKGERQYFNSNRIKTEGDWIDYAVESLDFWMVEANKRGLAFTIKHYPFTIPVEDELANENLLREYAKTEEQMRGVPKELSVDTINPDDLESRNSLMEIKQKVHVLMEKRGSGNVVMLTSRLIREYGYVPYILTEEPQKDPFLTNFEGLIVSDDLYQISLNEDRAIQAFKNVDMVIISSPSDFKIFVESVAKRAKNNQDLMRLLIQKSDKVKKYREKKLNTIQGS